MARIRTIKPEFFLNDQLAQLHPLTRMLFIGLWCLADKAGRLEDKPQKIKVQVLPYDKYDVNGELDILAKNGFIVRYSVEGVKFIQVSTFEKHQRVHHTEKESEIPPCNGVLSVISPIDNGEMPDLARIDIIMEGKGRERKGKERYGDAILLTKNEFDKLIERYGEESTNKAIEILDQYVMSKGKKYNSHYHTILGWPVQQAMYKGNVTSSRPQPQESATNCPKCGGRCLKTDIENGQCLVCATKRKENAG